VDENYRFNGKHLSVYDQTKAEAHAVAEQFIAKGLPLVIVQPGVIYGPDDTSSVRTSIILFLQGKLPMMPEKTAFTWAHVDDIAGVISWRWKRVNRGELFHLRAGPYVY
jgi:nucleoside-diphosphate-sugar epimerase